MSRQTSLEERLQIVALSEAGLTNQAIAENTGWSVSVVRKWRRRHKKEGRPGLASSMGRPQHGALSSYPKTVREQIHRMREQHPGWGPKTIYEELRQAGKETWLPAPGSLGRYLKEQGLSRGYQRHSELPNTKPPTATRPHHLWMMDARGPTTVPEIGLVALINISDYVSRLRAMSYPVIAGQKRVSHNPDTADYQTALRLAFTDYGLPECIQVDRATVFYDSRTKSPFPTPLHLWLMALGIELCFSRPRTPTDQAVVERSHQLWAQQCLQGQAFTSWIALFQTLRARRNFINQYLPCASLDNQPSLVAFPQAAHSGRPYRPEYEHELLELSRIWQYLAKSRWFRLVSDVGTFSIGGQQYYLDYTLAGQQIELTFNPDQCAFACQHALGNLLAHIPIRGISLDTLMGDLPSHLPMFQLHLPFDWNTFQLLRIFDTMES
jgi:transposase